MPLEQVAPSCLRHARRAFRHHPDRKARTRSPHPNAREAATHAVAQKRARMTVTFDGCAACEAATHALPQKRARSTVCLRRCSTLHRAYAT